MKLVIPNSPQVIVNPERIAVEEVPITPLRNNCITTYLLSQTKINTIEDYEAERTSYSHDWGILSLVWAKCFIDTITRTYDAIRFCTDKDGIVTKDTQPGKDVIETIRRTQLTPYGQLVAAINASGFSVGVTLSGGGIPLPMVSTFGSTYPILIDRPGTKDGSIVITAPVTHTDIGRTNAHMTPATDQTTSVMVNPDTKKEQTGTANYSAVVYNGDFISNMYDSLQTLKQTTGGSYFLLIGSSLSFSCDGITAREFLIILNQLRSTNPNLVSAFIAQMTGTPLDAIVTITTSDEYGGRESYTRQR